MVQFGKVSRSLFSTSASIIFSATTAQAQAPIVIPPPNNTSPPIRIRGYDPFKKTPNSTREQQQQQPEEFQKRTERELINNHGNPAEGPCNEPRQVSVTLDGFEYSYYTCRVPRIGN